MKKIILLITSVVLLSGALVAQTIQPKNLVGLSTKMKKASTVLKSNSTSNNLVNGNFETWLVDSIESFSGKTIRFMRPDMWAPVNGLFIAYFLDLDIPVSATLNGTNTAAKIEIADMGFGADLATVIPTTARPHNLQGEFQFNGATAGIAYFEVIATKFNIAADSSEIIGAGFFKADENTNGTFDNFVARMDYINETDIPDSIYVFASYLEGDLGTWFKFDNLLLNYSPTGVQTNRSEELSVYPNPSHNQLKIKLANNAAIEDATVEIRSIDGSLKLKLTNYQSNQVIDISSLTSGLYILNVQDATGVMSKKISKI